MYECWQNNPDDLTRKRSNWVVLWGTSDGAVTWFSFMGATTQSPPAVARERHDRLTGIYNRGRVLTRSRLRKSACDRGGGPLVRVPLDVDQFKDQRHYGHHAGDLALESVAKMVRAELRIVDVIGRSGRRVSVVLIQTELGGARVTVPNASAFGWRGTTGTEGWTCQVTVSPVSRSIAGVSLWQTPYGAQTRFCIAPKPPVAIASRPTEYTGALQARTGVLTSWPGSFRRAGTARLSTPMITATAGTKSVSTNRTSKTCWTICASWNRAFARL